MAGTSAAERAFAFLPMNERPDKPRSRGVTEIRGPYYAHVGRRYLEDMLETVGACVDSAEEASGALTRWAPYAGLVGHTRLNHRNVLPKAVGAMAGLEDVVAESTLEPALLEPVKTRASQLNGCAGVGGYVSPLAGGEVTR